MQVRISPDLRIIANKLSQLATADLTPIIEQAVEPVGPQIVEAFRRAAPVKSGASAASISGDVIVGGRGRSATVRITGKSTLRYVLRGTRPHLIEPRRAGGRLAFIASDGTLVFARRVNHPGTAPNPFTERAWADIKDDVFAQVRETGLRAYRDLAGFNL